MKIRTVLAFGALSVLGTACTVETDTLGVDSFDSPAAEGSEPAETVAAAPSTCDVVREALLTGGPADIEGAMAALKADTTADATAREYADYYMGRDAGDAEMQEMDASLIRMSCTI